MRAIPTLGYRSRTDAVEALYAQGHTRSEIARMIGCTKGTVSGLLCFARKRNIPRRDRTWDGTVQTAHIWRADAEVLKEHAQRRGLQVSGLVRRLVETIVKDGLVDSVLDDDGQKVVRAKCQHR